jgi:hypothetical protein
MESSFEMERVDVSKDTYQIKKMEPQFVLTLLFEMEVEAKRECFLLK